MARLQAPKLCAVNDAGVTGNEICLDKLKIHQKKDVAIHNIARQIYLGIPLDLMEAFEFEDIKDKLHLVNAIVMVRDGDKDKVLIPTKDALEFVSNAHNDDLIGHVGLEKLLSRIENIAYIDNLERCLKLVQQHCGICAQTKDQRKVNTLYLNQTMPAPAERWHIDIHGPITVNDKKYFTLSAQ